MIIYSSVIWVYSPILIVDFTINPITLSLKEAKLKQRKQNKTKIKTKHTQKHFPHTHFYIQNA